MPTPGTIVLYTLTTEDTVTINQRRFQTSSGRTGNVPTPGEVVPAIVIHEIAGGGANLQAFLDGNDSHWVTGAMEGEGAGFWTIPK